MTVPDDVDVFELEGTEQVALHMSVSSEPELYDKAYFDALDHGDGYQDSNMWRDIGHIIFEVLIADKLHHVDRANEHTAIDVGCAFGYLVRNLRSRGVEAFGVDISKYAISHVDPDIAPYVRTFDLEWVDGSYFGYDKFTIVTCFETMEHIQERYALRALRHMFNMLAPGGIAVMNICTSENDGWDTDSTHVNIAKPSWWRDTLEAAGFRHRDDLVAEFRRFWLFYNHPGLFVVERPL